MGELVPLPMDGVPAKPVPRVESPLAEATYLLFGEPANKAEWGRWAKAMTLLEEAGVTDAELGLLVIAYRAKFPDAAMTLMAVATRPGELRAWVKSPPPAGSQVARELEWRRQIAEKENHDRHR